MSNLMTTITIRLETAEKEQWQQYANEHHKGSLSGMIKAIVTNHLSPNNLDKTSSNLNSDLLKAIIDNSQAPLISDINQIKLLLYDLLAKEGINQKEKVTDLVKSRIKAYIIEHGKESYSINDVYDDFKQRPELKSFFESNPNPWNDFYIIFTETNNELEKLL